MKISREHILDWMKSIVYAGIVIILLYFLFWPLKIEGSSMESTFFSGDRVMVSRALSLFPLSRYDIIVCNIRYKEGYISIVKRIIAMPSEHLEIINGVVYVDGKQIGKCHVQNIVRDNLSITLGEDEYFVMGDNRYISKDSRHIGPIRRRDVVARVLFN